MRKLLLVAALVVLPSVRAQSQDAPIVATWDSVFRATFDAYDGRDWRALAREADPRALEERKDVVFRYRAIWEARPSAAHRERTVVDVLTLRRTGDHWRAMLNGGLLTPLWDGADMMNAVQ
jgi:hypothetical protein